MGREQRCIPLPNVAPSPKSPIPAIGLSSLGPPIPTPISGYACVRQATGCLVMCKICIVRTLMKCRRESAASSLTLRASCPASLLRRGVALSVAKRAAIPPHPPPPLPALLLLVLPRSSNEPDPEILAYDD